MTSSYIKQRGARKLPAWLAPLLSTGMLVAQTVGQNGRLPSITEQLKKHGIELTETDLLAAIENKDGEVRWLAAQELAEMKDVGAIQAIENALSRESQPVSRVNIAYALALLNDREGITALQDTCSSSGTASWLRMRAARYLLDRGVEGCQEPLMGLLAGSDDEGRVQALSLLPLYHHIGKQQYDTVIHLVQACLAAESPMVRIAAGQALAQLGDIAAIPTLQHAIANETQEAISDSLRSNLETLQRLQQKTAGNP